MRPANDRLLSARAGVWAALLFLAGAAGAAGAEFSLPDLEGEPHRLSDYRGRWVVVNYWATWCRPCLEELPELERFHRAHAAGKAVVLAVNMEDIGHEELRRFVARQRLTVPVLVAGTHPQQPVGRIPALPTTFLVDPRGEVVARQVGPVTAAALERYIEQYEAQPRPEGV